MSNIVEYCCMLSNNVEPCYNFLGDNMLGALIGDIVGSRFEWINNKSKEFDLFARGCVPTDDSIMSLAVAKALMDCNGDYSKLHDIVIKDMVEIGRRYPHCGYGTRFSEWILEDDHKPYNSYGNGSAMRVSPCGYVGNSLKEVKMLSKIVSEVSHNHREGIKGAEAVAVAIYLARKKKSIEEIKQYIIKNYYNINFTLDEIRDSYQFEVSCQKSVPQALEAFFESTSFEDAIRNAISIGGDSDTIACMAGSIASAYYGIPDEIRNEVMDYLDTLQQTILLDFENKFEKRL